MLRSKKMLLVLPLLALLLAAFWIALAPQGNEEVSAHDC